MPVREAWNSFRRWWAVVLIIRFSVLIPVTLLLAVLVSNQIVDILVDIAERPLRLQIAALLALAAFAGFSTWYCARTMLRFRFAGVPESDPAVLIRFKAHAPRILAMAVPLIISLRLAMAAGVSSKPAAVWWLSGWLFAVSLIVGVYVYQRRRVAMILRAPVLAVPWDEELRGLARWSEAPPSTRRVFHGLLLLNVVAMAVVTYSSGAAVAPLGAPAVLLLGLGLMAVTGSALIYWANHHGIPILLLLALLIGLFSRYNDNHALRYTASSHSHASLSRAARPQGVPEQGSALARQSVKDYIARWWNDLPAVQPDVEPSARPAVVPVVVVSAEGGGIRAAYWTAAVLAALESRSGELAHSFSRQVFAVSGVSGGSVGAAVFASAVQRRNTVAGISAQAWLDEIDAVLGQDFLTPTLAQTQFPELLQRLLPAPVLNDRAIALERSWERAWIRNAHATDELAATGLAAPFHNLWSDGDFRVPILVMNSTVVETGQRAIVMPLASDPAVSDATFADALLVTRYTGTQLPLSTAAHLSARFTYVSPAALLDTARADGERWLRLVDGGYFDNSGSITAAELVQALREVCRSLANCDKPGWPAMRILVLHLPNEPVNPRTAACSDGRAWMSEELAPIRALLATRNARGRQGVEALRSDEGIEFITVAPSRDRMDLPLGWVLSEAVRKHLRMQLETCTASTADCAARKLDEVIQYLWSEGPAPDRSDPYRQIAACR